MSISMTFTGLKGLASALDPAKFKAALDTQVGIATGLNAKVAEAAIRITIKSGVDPRNAALTQAIKGGDKALIDSSALWANITSKQMSPYKAFVGTLRSNKTFNVAAIVHEGATIKVTPAMRGMFFRLYKARTDAMVADSLSGRTAELFERHKEWLPLNPSTTSIVIPSRPYITTTFADAKLTRIVRGNWEKAVGKAFRVVVANSGGAPP